MKTEKIAILTDSGCDIPKEMVLRYNMHVLPLKVMYGMETYNDGEDIEPQTVYERFKEQIPTTSTPNLQEVLDEIEKIKEEGYTKVIAICISSGLSGTYNTIRLAFSQTDDIESYVFDTKNISFGAGIFAVYAGMLLEQNNTFDTIVSQLDPSNSKVFFYMDTLEYLKAGGRIGGIKGFIGKALDLRPIISCNEEGVYYTAAMLRGNRNSIKKLVKQVLEYDDDRKYLISILHGDAEDKITEVRDMLQGHFKNGEIIAEKQITASMAVHTGPGLVGIVILRICG